MTSIDWDKSLQSQYESDISRIQSEFQTSASVIRNRAPAEVLGIQDAQSLIAQAKSNIESGNSLLQTRLSELKSKLQAMLQSNEQSAARIKMLETQVQTNQSVVKEAETLAKLRKEQADELMKKGEGNYHSSWMGLWRPLSEQSQFGLFVASIFFGIVSLVTGFFVVKQFLTPGSAAGELFNQLGGGLGRRRK